jgi:hypothetical protein
MVVMAGSPSKRLAFKTVFTQYAPVMDFAKGVCQLDCIRSGPEDGMKVNVEVECTPEEARRFLGLPDVTKANDVYVDAVAKAMQGVGSLDQLGEYAKQLAPMGQMGLKMFQQFMETSAKSGGGKAKD